MVIHHTVSTQIFLMVFSRNINYNNYSGKHISAKTRPKRIGDQYLKCVGKEQRESQHKRPGHMLQSTGLRENKNVVGYTIICL